MHGKCPTKDSSDAHVTRQGSPWYRVDAPSFYGNYCWIGIPDSTHCKGSKERSTLHSTPISTTKQIILQPNNKSVSTFRDFALKHDRWCNVNTLRFFSECLFKF